MVAQFKKSREAEKTKIEALGKPGILVRQAPYKLAYVIGREKLPLSACSTFVDFAKSADPSSTVFQQMASSRFTVTEKTLKIHEKVLSPELFAGVSNSPWFSIVCDESTDISVSEQLIVYARYVDVQARELVSRFIELRKVCGHPNAENITSTILDIIGPNGHDFPLSKLVCLSTDGASVMQSPIGGVIAKLRERLRRPQLVSQHCCTHRLVLAGKDAQKGLPSFIEANVAEIMKYFKHSAVRKDKFSLLRVIISLQEINKKCGISTSIVLRRIG